jgi:hypothetical protein
MNPVKLRHPDLLPATARQDSCASIPSPPDLSPACPTQSLISRAAIRYYNPLTALARGKPEIETP